ncbi:hypothetical protein KY289_013568 [Solanum tuberosum]|nr:hypothetical protein KY289_013568 [Solanum tuberosum]
MHLSGMQLVKGFKKGEPTFLVALVGSVENSIEAVALPLCIVQVLDIMDMMSEKLPQQLPTQREVDCKIKLILGAKPPAMTPYRMAASELEELRTKLKEMLDVGHIRPSKEPFGAHILFQKKKEWTLCLFINYRALNKVMVKNKYLIPLTADLFDRLGQAKVVTKMDLRKGYYLVRITEGDESKTTYVTRYWALSGWSCQFGLTNAPATFCTLMNKFNNMSEHVEHLRKVFIVLRDSDLCVKREKCSFTQSIVQFLGHTISHSEIRMDNDKVEEIRDWETPTKVPDLRSFLGLTNYYRRFIFGYSAIVAPLIDLLKKIREWKWSGLCNDAFEKLKAAITKELILALPDFTKPFEIQNDTSDFAISGVLTQEGHSIKFERRKLNDAERRYSAHEREMTTVVHCLRTWRHYVLGVHFVVKMDNVVTTYFQSQKKLTAKQACWQDFLAEFDFTFEYKPGKANVVADALSRKVASAAIGMQHDPVAKQLLVLAQQGKAKKFWEENSLMYTTGKRVYVPRWANLRRTMIKEGHDIAWVGHPGQKWTLALLESSYYLPRM